MQQLPGINTLKIELKQEEALLKYAIQKDVPFEQAKQIKRRISHLEQTIAAAEEQRIFCDANTA